MHEFEKLNVLLLLLTVGECATVGNNFEIMS